MQTKHEIQALLAAQGASANTHYGQHFLIDLNLMRLIVESATITDRDVVLEVGCGTGSLTEALVDEAGHVVAVDLDTTVFSIAQAQLADADNVTLLNCDVLKNKHTLNPMVTDAIRMARRRHDGRLLLVANLPYHVASAVIMNCVIGAQAVDAFAVTVQKEVGDRMLAASGGRAYGSLSIWLHCAGDMTLLRVLKPGVFWPPPQVNSALIRFTRNQRSLDQIKDVGLLRDIIELFLGHRRKMLKACIKTTHGRLAAIDNWQELFSHCHVDPTCRPDHVSPEQYVALANAVCELDVL
jgi:16S rRNA (adenine1518-N6/adenine1519-N6)-dimethyltransferase